MIVVDEDFVEDVVVVFAGGTRATQATGRDDAHRGIASPAEGCLRGGSTTVKMELCQPSRLPCF
jgi:hypothetical protein